MCKTTDAKGSPKTNCNGLEAAQGCKMKFMSKEAAVYGAGHGANWHPTRAFHMLRGEAISWLYTLCLLDAIYLVEEDLKTKSPADLSKGFIYQIYHLILILFYSSSF